MPQSLSQVYLHIVFSTKYRTPLILPEIRADLYKYIGGVVQELGGIPLAISGVYDHIHILVSFPRDMTIADFIKRIKINSSIWIKSRGNFYKHFYWQSGYGVFSVSSYKRKIVENYIRNQEEHHKNQNFQREFVRFLNAYRIEYDERYLWD